MSAGGGACVTGPSPGSGVTAISHAASIGGTCSSCQRIRGFHRSTGEPRTTRRGPAACRAGFLRQVDGRRGTTGRSPSTGRARTASSTAGPRLWVEPGETRSPSHDVGDLHPGLVGLLVGELELGLALGLDPAEVVVD